MRSLYLLCFFCYSLHTHTHTHTHTHDRVMVISALCVEMCLFKVRSASEYEDDDTQDSVECRFCASLKSAFLCPLNCLCVLYCVSMWGEQVFVCLCLSIVHVCLLFCVWAYMHQQEFRGSGVCLVSRCSGNSKAQISAGSSVMLRGSLRSKFTLLRYGEGGTGLAMLLSHTHTHTLLYTHTHTHTYTSITI